MATTPQAVSTQLHSVASQIDTLISTMNTLEQAAAVAETLPIQLQIGGLLSYTVNDSETQNVLIEQIANQRAPLTAQYESLVNGLITFLQSVVQA